MSDHFLAKAAERVLEFSDGEPEKLAVVLPSQRAAVYFRRHYAERVGSVQFTPHLLTLDQFVGDFSPLRKADQIDLLFRLFADYCKVWKGEAETFDRFLKWAPMALADFSEIDAYQVDSRAFFRDLTNLKELDEWSLNEEDLTNTQQQYAWFWKKLGELYHTFNASLRKDQLAYSGMLFRDAAENIGQRSDQLAFRRVFFCGFNALSRSEESIMQHFVSTDKAEMLWDADRFYMDYEKHEAGMFLRRNLKHFKGTEGWVSDTLTGAEKSITIAATPNEVAQTDLMAQLLKTSTRQTQTAVVLANQNLLIPVLNALPESVESANVTMGLNTRHSPLHSLFDLLFEWINSRTPDGRYHYRYATRLLGHPYLNFSEAFSSRSRKLVSNIKKRNKVFLDSESINELTDSSEIREFFREISISERSAPKQLQAQFALIDFVIRSLGTGDGYALEKEYLFHYLRTLRKIERLVSRFPGEMGGEAYARIFGSLTSADKLNFVGEPLEGVQVMGMLETRALDFENLIVLSCNEHVMPGSSSQQSLIPFELKKYHQLPTQTEKEAIYAYYFYRLLQRARKVHLVYSTDTSNWQGAEPSRYLAQLKYDLKHADKVQLQSVITQTEDRSATREERAIVKTETVIGRLIEKLKVGLSPSALNSYIQCPLDFYYTYVIGYREENEVEETIEHSTLGSAVHEVLEKLYEPHKKQGVLKAEDVAAMRPKVREQTRRAFEKLDKADSLDHGMNNLIFEVAVKFTDRFLVKEIQMLKEMAERNEFVEILELEKELDYTVEVPTADGLVSVKLNGNSDRIDKVGSTVRVIDYKTGKVEKTDVSIKTPEEEIRLPDKSKALQLLIYGLMYYRSANESHNVMAANVSMRNLGELLIPVSWEGEETLSEAHWNQFEALLKDILSEMLSSEPPLEHRADAKYCNFCDVEVG